MHMDKEKNKCVKEVGGAVGTNNARLVKVKSITKQNNHPLIN